MQLRYISSLCPRARAPSSSTTSRAPTASTDAARRHVVDAASGNPLFVEELLALVLEQGATPASSRSRRRSRRSSPRGSTACQTTSVRCWKRPLSRARCSTKRPPASSPRSHRTTYVGISSPLCARSSIRPDRPLFSGERAFIFRHLLIRDAAYEAVPKEVRARLHERYADWLERGSASGRSSSERSSATTSSRLSATARNSAE